jgi:hypothetical protein
MRTFDSRSPVHYLIAAVVAAFVLCAGLSRFGIWQPSELHVADSVRDGGSRPDDTRPALQWALTRLGFQRLGASEFGGRLPSALFATMAAIALGLAVGRASDARTGAMTTIAYATMPLVFLNARMMLGGGIAQSGATMFLAALIEIVWGRPPPESRMAAHTVWRFGRWALLLVVFVTIHSAGVMLGVLPVLLGVAFAIAMRWQHEPWSARATAILTGFAGFVLAVMCIRAAIRPPEYYSVLLGVGPGAHPPAAFPTWDSMIEQIGLALFPWTGLAVWGCVRLLQPPPTMDTRIGIGGEQLPLDDAWREAGMRLAMFGAVTAGLGLQTFHLQQLGMLPFVMVAPLAVACAVVVRDAEREARPWRVVAAGATFGLVIIMRDYLLFPKSSYAALALPDGGPAFPTGFTGALKDWIKAHGASGIVDVFRGTAPAEVYVAIIGMTFLLSALAVLFMGASPSGDGAGAVRPIGWLAPYHFFARVESAARREFGVDHASLAKLSPVRRWLTYFTPAWLLANLRFALLCVGVAISTFFGWMAYEVGAHHRFVARGATVAQVKSGYVTAALVPLVVVGCVFAFILLWNVYTWFGAEERPWRRAIGSRLVVIPVSAVFVTVIFTQLYWPALSEHLSPRGVWAVLRQFRSPGEPVARWGGPPNDRATRYYADFEVRDLHSQDEALQWLQQRTPRHYLVVGADSFSQLNFAYREAQRAGLRTNIPVLDVPSGAVYIAASSLGDRESRNPLDSVVFSSDTQNHGGTDHWHAHGRREAGRFVEEPARFGDYVEYLGYNLDSNNRAYVPVGESFRITYHFRVLRELPPNYRMFVHLESPACPRSVHDHETGNGKWPVRFWLAGDYVHDEQRITVPAECHAGSYSVYIGFWQAEQRLPVSGGNHDAENRVVAAVINVR